ncbi:MAG: hypothetical protein JNK05_24000 [Myxococcales bacterium]|nr:hypothetical protein [Myxococcales bacterium]
MSIRRASVASLVALVVASSASVAHAAILRVGTGEMYATVAAAHAAAADGDTIEIRPGTYREEVVLSRNNLTVRAMPGGAVIFDRTGMPVVNQGGKGIFIVDGANARIEGITFVGAACSSRNGSGIRWQGMGTLTVRSCVFRDNENGILGGNHSTNVAVIEGNEFVGNGRGDLGFTHNIYINEIAELRFVGNWSHALYTAGADVGHLVKTRARTNLIAYNRLTAESNFSSYEIQLTGGGVGYIIGNLIHQGTNSRNSGIISIGGDGTQHPNGRIFIVNNTIVNELGRGNIIAINAQPMLPVRIVNNLIVGAGTLSTGGMTSGSNNVMAATPMAAGLTNAAMFDYRLAAGSPAINAGIDPGMDGAMALRADREYTHPRTLVARGTNGAIDVGAYEFGATVADAGVDAATDSGSTRDATVADTGASDTGIASDTGVEQDSGGAMDSGVILPADTGVGSEPPGTDGSVASDARGDTGPAMNASGCGCRVTGAHDSQRGTPWRRVALSLLALGWIARRRTKARAAREARA